MKTVIFFAVSLFVIAAFNGCKNDRIQPTDVYAGVTVGDIMKNPQPLYGKQLVVSGEVEEVFTRNALLIGGSDFLGGSLLVVSPEPLPQIIERPAYPKIREGDIIQIKGVLRRATPDQIKRDYDFDIKKEFKIDFSKNPVFIAQQTNVTARSESSKQNAGSS